MSALTPGKKAPAFSLADTKGKERSLQDWLARGQTLVAFFKVSCPTCQYTFPFLERLNGSPVNLVGISQDDDSKTEDFNRQFGVRFPVLLDEAGRDYPTSNAFGITNVPTLFLVEPDGRISLTSVGFVKADLEEIARRTGAKTLFHRDEKIEAFRAG